MGLQVCTAKKYPGLVSAAAAQGKPLGALRGLDACSVVPYLNSATLQQPGLLLLLLLLPCCIHSGHLQSVLSCKSFVLQKF